MARSIAGLSGWVLSGLLAGCGPVVTVSGTDPTGDESTTSGTPNEQPSHPGCSCSTGPSPAANAHAQTQPDGSFVVEVTSYAQTCDEFTSTAPCGPAATWKVGFTLPANTSVGDVIPLDQNGFVFETDADDGEIDGCAAGGGSFWEGVIVVSGWDGTGFTLSLEGTSAVLFGSENVDGTYYASLCGDAPPVPSTMTSAVATPLADGTLQLSLSSLPNTCVEPSPGADCSVAAQNVSILLPASMQAPGTYALDGIATFSVSEPSGAGECSGGGGSYWGGTVEVLAIDGATISFTLAGTDDFFLPAGNADGTFVAPLCGGALE
ncbi:MAG: hypothetical protein U0414_21140 [Polyangiaceae bacterium]